MKTVYACCILFLIFSGPAFAQLKCRYCEVTPAGQATKVSVGIDYVEILSRPGTFTGNIVLKDGGDGTSHFDILDSGHYRIDGVLSSMPGATRVGLTVYAPWGGSWGGQYSGLTLAGSSPNTYTGRTVIASGYLACNKPAGTVAIPGDIEIGPHSGGPREEVGLWFGANHQLSGKGKIYFNRYMGPNAIVSLNGTTQTITGLHTNNNWPLKNECAIVENIDPRNPTRIPGLTRNFTDKAVLILDGGSEPYIYGGTYNKIRSGPGNGGLEIRVKGTGQYFSSLEYIENVTFNSQWGSVVEFNAYGPPKTLGDGITFKGYGTIKKTTGTGTPLSLAGSTMSLYASSRIWVAAGVLKNTPNKTIYPANYSNKNNAILQVDRGATFDLNGVNSIFDALEGNGKVESSSGYVTLTLDPDETHIFNGEIRDDTGQGGVVIQKNYYGTQVFTGEHIYPVRIEVAAGTLKLQGRAKLSGGTYTRMLKISNSESPPAVFEHNGTESQTFIGEINIQPHGYEWATYPELGIFRQSGSGQSIINGTNDFTGNVEITGGFLGGSGSFSKANGVTVGAQGRIGGGNGSTGSGHTLTVSTLTFSARSSTLVVSSKPDNTPGLVVVSKWSEEQRSGNPGIFSAPNGFTVDILGDNIVSGYLIRCRPANNRLLPVLGRHNSAKSFCFNWDTNGLLMTVSSDTNPLLAFNQPPDITIHSGDSQPAIQFTSSTTGNLAPTGYQWKQKGMHSDIIAGLEDYTADWTRTAIPAFTVPATTLTTPLKRSLEVTGRNTTTGCMATKTFTYTVEPAASLTCDNCSFTKPGSTDIVTGTTQAPAIILSGRSGEFIGNITLNGPCTFTIRKAGNYILSGQISGIGPLTCHANEAGGEGKEAGITLIGNSSNTYTGLTRVTGGYVICNKTNAVAIPNDLRISAVSGTILAHLWCKANNQFGSSSVVDFSDAVAGSYLHLNGTTQNIAGLKGNNSNGLVENWEPTYRPASLANEEPTGGAILNIAVAADTTSCIFGGGGQIRRGTTTQAFTINVTGGTQIIENLANNITNVIFISAGEATLEFGAGNGTINYSSGITLKGNGTIKKTGPGVLVMINSTVLKSGGQIWVEGGTLRNEGTTHYSNNSESNRATLRIEAEAGSPAPVFDLRGNNSIFGGLTGNGIVQNNFGASGTSPGEGYNELLLRLTKSYTFSGVIQNNTTNATPESGGGEGRGGVALKIEGNNRTQSLSGVNLYTGSTTISSGELALIGAGQLGNGTYAGVLEISNAAAQATFEHNGTATQTFTGNIIGTGEGVKGIFLQSGTGKTILTGTKTFAGDITIINGFLGGAGRLKNVNSVSVDGTGSIGGGNGEEGNGATLTLKSLSFKSVSAKLIVTSKPDNTCSLLEVQSLPTSTNVSNFTVDILGGASLQEGCLIKYPTNDQRINHLPRPVVGVNNTGKVVHVDWDNLDLWLAISKGTISVGTDLVCPRGSNPGNPKITVIVTYYDARDLPAAEGAVYRKFFTLTDNRAKSGDIEVSKKGNVITAQFDGANPTDADLPYTIYYEDNRNFYIRAETHINRRPALSVSSGTNPTYLGSTLVLQGVSKDGTGTISSQHTAVATVGSTTAALTATATTLTTGHVDFLLTDSDGCKSDYLNVAVISDPHITEGSANKRLSSVTSIVGESNSSMTFSVFPVPAQDQITIVNEGDDLQHITIRDINGKTVVSQAVNGRKATLQVDHLASGIYILTVTGAKEMKHLKISKK